MTETSLQAVSKTHGRVLAVEDDPTSRAILISLLEELGYDFLEAEDGRNALDIIEREAGTIDVIVLDKVMPEMDGLEVVSILKDDPKAKHIPIVMVTGAKKPEEVKEGIDAGVFYYLTKPYEDNVFKSVMTSAMREAERRITLRTELTKHQTSFNYIKRAEFEIQTLEQAEDLACFLANCFPNPDTTLPGLAGLLVNAVEHGNLEIGYNLKTELLNGGTWRQEVERRSDMPEYADRKVHIEFVRDDENVSVRIKDGGSGFNWQKYMEIDPARALDTHGRGIAQANKISFDVLEYNESGNSVTATSNLHTGIEW